MPLRFAPSYRLLGVLLIVLAMASVMGPAAAQAQPVPITLGTTSPTLGMTSGIPFLSDLLGAGTGIDDVLDYIKQRAGDYAASFREWGRELYILLFALQFVLIGLNLIIRGPFALATSRSIHPLNPFSNLIFFYLAGAVGYLFVFYAGPEAMGPGTGGKGWVAWFFTLFSETGEELGCNPTGFTGFLAGIGIGACDPGELLSVGTQISGALLIFADASGIPANDPFNWVLQGLGSTTVVFAAYSILAIQLALTEGAFVLMAAAAPLFIATLVFRPLSGISTGFIKLLVYLSVKIFILYLVAGIAAFIGDRWLQSFVINLVTQLVFSAGSPDIGKLLASNFSLTATAMFIIALTLYLPARVAGFIAGSVNMDLHSMLFSDQTPIPF